LRVVSAAVLAPIPLAAIWFGEPWLAVLAAFAGGGMAWEWSRLCLRGAWGLSGWVLIAIVVAAVAAGAARGVASGVVIAAIGAGLVYALAWGGGKGDPVWLAFGTIWVAVPCVLQSDRVVAVRGRLGDRYRRLHRRPHDRRAAPRTLLEPEQDLGRSCRRRALRRDRRLGHDVRI
jgi:hypothetical protein